MYLLIVETGQYGLISQHKCVGSTKAMQYKIKVLPYAEEKNTNCEKVKKLTLWKVLSKIYYNFVIFVIIPCLIVAFWYVLSNQMKK
jgi:hypothetical protein